MFPYTQRERVSIHAHNTHTHFHTVTQHTQAHKIMSFRGGKAQKVMVFPINHIFRFLQSVSPGEKKDNNLVTHVTLSVMSMNRPLGYY